jgi:hypothetical protein
MSGTRVIIKTRKYIKHSTGDVTVTYTMKDHTEFCAEVTGDVVRYSQRVLGIDAVAVLEHALIAECYSTHANSY